MELLIVIVILGILITLGGASFTGSQKKGRDSKRKADLRNIAVALEQYYTDKGQYPGDNNSPTGKIYACGTGGTSLCDWGYPFIDQNTVVYMLKLPDDPIGALGYYYDAIPAQGLIKSYQLYAHLENTEDPEIITPNNTSLTGTSCGSACNYGVASSATTP